MSNVTRREMELHQYRMNLYKRRKRQRDMKKLVYKILITTVFLVLLVSTPKAFAQEVNTDSYEKCFESICVGYGESLESIALSKMDSRFYNSADEYISEVMRMNGLKSEHITPGNYIVVPYYVEIH